MLVEDFLGLSRADGEKLMTFGLTFVGDFEVQVQC